MQSNRKLICSPSAEDKKKTPAPAEEGQRDIGEEGQPAPAGVGETHRVDLGNLGWDEVGMQETQAISSPNLSDLLQLHDATHPEPQALGVSSAA